MPYQNFTDFLKQLDEKYHAKYAKLVEAENAARLDQLVDEVRKINKQKIEVVGSIDYIEAVRQNLKSYAIEDLYACLLRSFAALTDLHQESTPEDYEAKAYRLQGQVIAASALQKKVDNIRLRRSQK